MCSIFPPAKPCIHWPFVCTEHDVVSLGPCFYAYSTRFPDPIVKLMPLLQTNDPKKGLKTLNDGELRLQFEEEKNNT